MLITYKRFQIGTCDLRTKYSEINGGSNDVSLKPIFLRAVWRDMLLVEALGFFLMAPRGLSAIAKLLVVIVLRVSYF